MPATASTPGRGSLSSLARLAKSKIQTRSYTRFCPEIGSKMAPEISFPGSVTPGRLRSSWPQEIPMRRLIAAVLAIATGLNGLAMLVAGPLWYQTLSGASWPLQPAFRPGHRRGIPRCRSPTRPAGMAASILAGGSGRRRLFRRPQPRRTSCVVGSRAARCAHFPGVTDTTSAIS